MTPCSICGRDLASVETAYASVIDGSLVCDEQCMQISLLNNPRILSHAHLLFEEVSTADIGLRCHKEEK